MAAEYVTAAAALVVTALVVIGSPGPSTLSLTAAVIAHGGRAVLGYAFGLVLGTTAVLLAVATGITAVLLAVPGRRLILLLAAAAYLLWLAYRIATAAPLIEQAAKTSQPPTVLGGLALGSVNPKAWVAIGVVFAQSRLPANPAIELLTKIALLTGVIVIVHVAWFAAGRLILPLLRSPRAARVVNLSLAALLATSAVLTVAS